MRATELRREMLATYISRSTNDRWHAYGGRFSGAGLGLLHESVFELVAAACQDERYRTPDGKWRSARDELKWRIDNSLLFLVKLLPVLERELSVSPKVTPLITVTEVDALLRVSIAEIMQAQTYLAQIHRMIYSEDKMEAIPPAKVEADRQENAESELAYQSEGLESLGHDHLARLMIDAMQLAEKERALADSVKIARSEGISWAKIGKAVGITPQAAYRRWDPIGKEKHRQYRQAKQDD